VAGGALIISRCIQSLDAGVDARIFVSCSNPVSLFILDASPKRPCTARIPQAKKGRREVERAGQNVTTAELHRAAHGMACSPGWLIKFFCLVVS